MADIIKLHPHTPHAKRVFEIVDRLKNDQVVLLPTDTNYALACRFSSKKAIERIRTIRRLPKDHHFSLICDKLAKISELGYMNDDTFKLIKKLIPAPITFILKAHKVVPKLLVHPKKHTIGIRVPDYAICQSIVKELGEPLLAVTAKLPDIDHEPTEMPQHDFIRGFEKVVDMIIDDEQELSGSHSSIINLSNENVEVIREGEAIENFYEALSLTNLTLAEQVN